MLGGKKTKNEKDLDADTLERKADKKSVAANGFHLCGGRVRNGTNGLWKVADFCSLVFSNQD